MTGALTKQAIEDTINHFCRINGVDRSTFETHHAEARKEWERLNALSWTVDWGVYNPIVEEAQRKRKLRQRGNDLDNEEEEDHDEDQSLYKWPYLHSGEGF